MEEERIINQIGEKRKLMYILYNQSNHNLLDEKVLEKSMEIDGLINQIMKNRLEAASEKHYPAWKGDYPK